MVKMRREKGQALVESALTLPAILMVILLLIDPAFKALNTGLAKYYSFQAAREASIFLADGTHSCDAWVRGHVSPPILMLMTAWSLTISPCPADSSWSQVSGTEVTATYDWTQRTIFWSGPWAGQMSTKDVFQ